MAEKKEGSFFRAFFDFFILFSGASTASNLARTKGRPLRTRGISCFGVAKTHRPLMRRGAAQVNC